MEFTDGIEIDDCVRLVDDEWAQDGIECTTDFPELKSGDKEPFQQMTFTLADEQAEIVKEAVKKAQEEGCESEANQNRNGNALAMICEVFLGH
jgi:IMP dehydrogenase/GMP reductase